MKPKHIKALMKGLKIVRDNCDHDVSGEEPGTMCACAFLLAIIEEAK